MNLEFLFLGGQVVQGFRGKRYGNPCVPFIAGKIWQDIADYGS
jgi:hypothetical protein